MNIRSPWLILLLCITACSSQRSVEPVYNSLTDLSDSIKIIRELIKQDKINTIVEDCDKKAVELLINNTTPAQMALEAEVLACTVPLVLVYYCQKNSETESFLVELDHLIGSYQDDQIKCVIIDVDALPSLVENAGIETIPTLCFIHNRTIQETISDNISLGTIKTKISQYAILQ